MARSVGLKQDTMLYKVRVFSLNQFGEEIGISRTYGAYETMGTAKGVATNMVLHRRKVQRWNEERMDIRSGITWHHEITEGRMIWFEEKK